MRHNLRRVAPSGISRIGSKRFRSRILAGMPHAKRQAIEVALAKAEHGE